VTLADGQNMHIHRRHVDWTGRDGDWHHDRHRRSCGRCGRRRIRRGSGSRSGSSGVNRRRAANTRTRDRGLPRSPAHVPYAAADHDLDRSRSAGVRAGTTRRLRTRRPARPPAFGATAWILWRISLPAVSIWSWILWWRGRSYRPRRWTALVTDR
jgi:hypothetical protein